MSAAKSFRTGRPRKRWLLSLVVCSGLLGTFHVAEAAERTIIPMDALLMRLSDLEARGKEIEASLNRRPQEFSEADQAARRLTDAEVLYTLRNYDAAATILFDVVDRYQKTQAYSDALFYLGDSLYQSRSYLASRRYFEKLVEQSPGHPRYQEALLRLVEITHHLGALDQGDKWLERLAQVPKEKTLAAVPYIRGKSHFLRQEYDKALAALTTILPQSPYYFQARYFIGTVHVAKGSLGEAVQDFSEITSKTPRTDDERRIGELAHLALARLYYEQAQNTKAHEEYLQVSQKSDLFPEALYESAWVAIKAKEYKRALRQLELLVLAQPDSLNVPEAKLLMGNLQIRTGDHQPATKWFQKTREEFEPVRKQLEELVAQNNDSTAYFRELIRKHLDKFDISLMVPKIAARYMRADQGVNRFAGVASDVSELRRALLETEETVARLERALLGSGRYRVDPTLGAAREGAIESTGEVLKVRQEMANRMTELLSMAASADELRQMGEVVRRRNELEKDLQRVISTIGSRNKAEAARAQANELDKRASELQVHLNTLKQQREAVEKYYNQTRAKQKIPKEQFAKELAEITSQEQETVQKYQQLRKDLQDAMLTAENEGQALETNSQLLKEYSLSVKAEQEIFNTLRGRLSGTNKARADQVSAAMDRAYSLEERLIDLLGRVNGLLDTKLQEIQASILVEKTNLKEYRQSLGNCSNDTEEIGGGILSDVLQSTTKRFHDIVVRADVGIIDVAWAVKQQRTDKISRMVREQKRELKMLDDEFKEVLKE